MGETQSFPRIEGLLDSESWGAVLKTYARCVPVAVALVDHDGKIIGKCHNPTGIWNLARDARADWGSGCPFCLDLPTVCRAAAEAERTRSTVIAHGLGGLAHTASPIFLADRHLGTLLAGQAFVQYPELLLLERVAMTYGLSAQDLWREARKRAPVSESALLTYGTMLATLGEAYLQQRNAIILKEELAESNEKLRCSNQQLKNVNSELRLNVTQLNDSCGLKDILLNEVHHRVNNNLTVIGSLLRMQAEAFPDDAVANALRASQFRVESMALIHAHLYNAIDWRSVNFAAYTEVLADNLFRAYGVDRSRIQLRVEIGHLELGVDKAIPAGLILNELISNALKHAFREGRAGTLSIDGRLHEGQVELVVRDDGVGMKTVDAPTSEPQRQSLGMNIIKILCRQLRGTLEFPSGSQELETGSTFHLSFPCNTASRAASRV